MAARRQTSHDNLVMGQRVDREHAQRARELRREMTAEEALVWERVRRNGLAGLHFRRQQVIAGFIVDFYCHAARLVIEIDGGIHDQSQAYDDERDLVLAGRGLHILRLTNEEIRQDLAGSLAKLAKRARERIHSGERSQTHV